jgi:hypothetical protein
MVSCLRVLDGSKESRKLVVSVKTLVKTQQTEKTLHMLVKLL